MLACQGEKKLPDCASPLPSCFLSLLSRERLAAARRLGIRRASYLTLHGQSTRSAQPSPRGFPGDLIVGPRLVEAPPLAHGCVPFPRSADLLMEVRLPLETRRWKKDRPGLRCQDDGRSVCAGIIIEGSYPYRSQRSGFRLDSTPGHDMSPTPQQAAAGSPGRDGDGMGQPPASHRLGVKDSDPGRGLG